MAATTQVRLLAWVEYNIGMSGIRVRYINGHWTLGTPVAIRTVGNNRVVHGTLDLPKDLLVPIADSREKCPK